MPRKRLSGKTLEYDVARQRVYLKGGAATSNYPIFIPAISELNVSTQVYREITWFGALLTDGEDHEAYGLFMAPATATITLTPVIYLTASASSRNIRCKTSQTSAGDAESVALTTTGFQAIAVPAGTAGFNTIYVLSQTLSFSATSGDFIQAAFYRDGNNAADTIGADVCLFGFKVSYA